MSDLIKDFKAELGELFEEALTTNESPQQERVKKWLHTAYALIGNFFFMALSAILLCLLLQRLLFWLLGHQEVRYIIGWIWEQHYLLVAFYSISIVLGFLTAFAFTLKLLLKLYRFFGIVELSKLYFFGEVVWICTQYVTHNPHGNGPLPFFVQALRKLTGLD